MNAPHTRGRAAKNATRAAILAGLVLAVLTGCFRFTSDLEVTADNTVSGEYVVAVENGTGETLGTTDRELAQELWADTKFGDALHTERISDYSADGYTGISIVFTDEPLAAFAPTPEHWGIVREGDEFVVTGQVSGGAAGTPEPGTDPDESAPDIHVTLTFPGPVTEANGDINGRTVTWEVTDAGTNLQARADAVAPP